MFLLARCSILPSYSSMLLQVGVSYRYASGSSVVHSSRWRHRCQAMCSESNGGKTSRTLCLSSRLQVEVACVLVLIL
jgi:hypothetical protein